MKYISKQSKKFIALTTLFLTSKFKVRLIKYYLNMNLDNKYIYKYRNYIILSNKYINILYGTTKPESSFSCLVLNYQNINYTNRNDNKNKDKELSDNTPTNYCYLPFDKKSKITNDLKHFNFDETDIYVIGRKYTNKQSNIQVNNCFGVLCNIYNLTASKREQSQPKQVDENFQKNIRRDILMHLKNITGLNYLSKIIDCSLFFDIEFLVDIVDDFENFPQSKDLSMIFMAGIYTKGENYINYNINNISHNQEYLLLQKLLHKFKELVLDKGKLYVFHWGHSDKTVLNKHLLKYQDLHDIFLSMNIQFIDLMNICKQCIKSNSYSLKYIVKKLLNISYDSDCKNGADALESFLLDPSKVDDLIYYNKLDTKLLYDMVIHLTT